MLIGVVAHVNREDMAERLIAQVGADVFCFDHTFPPSPKGCSDNHIRVLRQLCMLATPGEFVVVLEDDAEPVDDFRNQLKGALLKTGSPLVGLHLGTGSPHDPVQQAVAPAVEAAEASQACWIVSDWFIYTIGYAVRSPLLSGLITAISSAGGPMESRINEWTHHARIKTWYTQPSLINHGDASSLINSAPVPPRGAHRFGTRTEWNRRTVEMGYARGWSPVA
jgi:hypothetical protein